MFYRPSDTFCGDDLSQDRSSAVRRLSRVLAIGLPLLFALMLFDLVLWWLAQSDFEICVALWCAL